MQFYFAFTLNGFPLLNLPKLIFWPSNLIYYIRPESLLQKPHKTLPTSDGSRITEHKKHIIDITTIVNGGDPFFNQDVPMMQ
ncbi:hypothetical protein WJ21_26655 [Burkholderia vietnamiensis]|nr:hypothetical protein WJ21_26655 [Burkholderia vietnamiensis]